MKKLLYLLTSIILLNIDTMCSGSKEIEDAIVTHNPEKLLKLRSSDLADLIEDKNEYISKAQQSTNKVLESLQSRFDWHDIFRLFIGAGMVGLGGYVLYKTSLIGIPLLKQWRHNNNQSDVASEVLTENPNNIGVLNDQSVENDTGALKQNNLGTWNLYVQLRNNSAQKPIADEVPAKVPSDVKTSDDQLEKPRIDKGALMILGAVGSSSVLLVLLGLLNIRKGLTKYDRLNKYYKALAVETNLQKWSQVKVTS